MLQFSIIVPIFNSEAYLRDCLNSILSSTFTDFELLLVNDGSTDKSGEICKCFEKSDVRISIIDKANGGVPSARNAGLDIAQGDYVLFVDSDDRLLPHTLGMVAQKLGQVPVDICQFQHLRFKEDAPVVPVPQEETPTATMSARDALVSLYLGAGVSSMVWDKAFRRSLIGTTIRFDDRCRYFAEDVLFLVEAFLQASSVASIDHPGYLYRHTPNSIVTSGLSATMFHSSVHSFESARVLLRDDTELAQLADELLFTSLSNWRYRREKVPPSDRAEVDQALSETLRRHRRSFLKNPNLSFVQKGLLVGSVVTLRVFDLWAFGSRVKSALGLT